MTTQTDLLHPERITTVEQAQMMRQIRNAGRDGFAHDTSEITEDHQRAWWAATYRYVLAWLYYEPLPPDEPYAGMPAAGYGLLRQTLDDGRWWSSCAVAPWARGRGYGVQIMRHLVQESPGRVWAEVRKDNPASLAMHKLDEWEIVNDSGPLYLLRTKGYGL